MIATSTRRKPSSRRRKGNNHQQRQQPAIRLITYEPGNKSLVSRGIVPLAGNAGCERYDHNEISQPGPCPFDSPPTNRPPNKQRTTTTNQASYQPTRPAAIRFWEGTAAPTASEQLRRVLPRPQIRDTPRPRFRRAIRRIILRTIKTSQRAAWPPAQLRYVCQATTTSYGGGGREDFLVATQRGGSRPCPPLFIVFPSPCPYGHREVLTVKTHG